MIYLLLIFFVLLQTITTQNQQQQQQNKFYPEQLDFSENEQKLLLVSLDAFHPDYLYKYEMKNLLKLASDGVMASYLKPTFITQTLPTHWSIVTGLYQESHGIISNSFHDPDYDENFKYDNQHLNNRNNNKMLDLKWWNQTEPLWYGAAREGLKCGSLYWPGASVKFMKTNYYKSIDMHHNHHNQQQQQQNDNTSGSSSGSSSTNNGNLFENKIEQAIKWLARDNYNFVALYDNQLDSISHRHGLSSLEFNSTLKQIDNYIGMLVAQLKKHYLYESNTFHLVIVSGYGLTEVKKHVFLDDYVKFSDFNAKLLALTSTSAHVKATETGELMKVLQEIPYIKVYTKETIPNEWNYRNNKRVGDLFILANEGINLHLRSHIPENIRKLNMSSDRFDNLFKLINDKANHGYDNSLNSMKALFIAKGGALRRNYKSSHYIEQVDVYPLMCNLLNIQCRPSNGSYERIKHYLRSVKHSSASAASVSSLAFYNYKQASLVFINLLIILPIFTFNYF